MMMKEPLIVASTLVVWTFAVALVPAQSWDRVQIPAPPHVVRQLSSGQVKELLRAVQKLIRTEKRLGNGAEGLMYEVSSLQCKPDSETFFYWGDLEGRLRQLARGDTQAYDAAWRGACRLQAETQFQAQGGGQTLSAVFIHADGTRFAIEPDGSVRYYDVKDFAQERQQALVRAIALWQAWGAR